MYTTLGISAEQVYGDMYAAWLRDTHEKNTADVKRLYTTMIDNGFGVQQVLLRHQRLGANFINSLVPLLHQSTLVKLDLHGNVLRDVGCELLAQVLRDVPLLTYLDIGANAIGTSTSSSPLAGGGGPRGKLGATRTGESTMSSTAGSLSRTGGGVGANSRGTGRGGIGGSSSGTNVNNSNTRTGSRYLSAMQGLGAAIAQHRNLSILILGSAKDESYANQIEEVGATCILEGCVLSHTLKRIDLSGNPFAVNCEVPIDITRRNGGGGIGGNSTALEDAAAATVGNAAGRTSNNNGTTDGMRGNAGPSTPGNASCPRAGGAGATAGVSNMGDNISSGNSHGILSSAGNGGYSGTRSGPRTPVELFAQLLRTSTTLTHVRLRAVGLSDSGAAYLLDAVGASHTLLRLDMSDNGFSSRVAEAAGIVLQQRTVAVRGGGKGCSLQSIVLSDNDLRDNGAAAALARRGSFGFTPVNTASGGRRENSVKTTLLPMGNEDGRIAVTAPVSASRYVNRTRALRDNAAGASPLLPSSASSPGFYAAASVASQSDSQAGMLLLSSLANDQFLTTLVLDSCFLDDVALFALCRSLLTNATLTVLALRNNLFTQDGVVQLGRALCRHPCLEKLLLSGNTIEDEGACALAVSLGYPEASLKELDVARTWLGDRGLIALGVALQTNTSLQVLYVADNHFTQEGGASFAALLENNQHVVRCELSGTSVPHHIVLRLERATARNRKKVDNAVSDALKKEVVRLHYQKYKLSEAQLELEALREKNADVKRTTETFDLQTRQGHNDFVKRIRELEEQIENAKQQEVKYGEQTQKLEADLTKAHELHEDEMTFAAERLAAEVKLREEAEEEFHAVERELEDWRQNGTSREEQKRAQLAEMKADQEAWASQRREYRERTAELQQAVAALEAAAAADAAAAKPGPDGKKGKRK